MPECCCRGQNDNCRHCFGTGHLPAGPAPLQSSALAPPPLNSLPPWVPSHTTPVMGLARSQAKGPLPSNPPSHKCSYCKGSFHYDYLRDEHVESEHIADEGDTSEQALAKPLVRRAGVVYHRETVTGGQQDPPVAGKPTGTYMKPDQRQPRLAQPPPSPAPQQHVKSPNHTHESRITPGSRGRRRKRPHPARRKYLTADISPSQTSERGHLLKIKDTLARRPSTSMTMIMTMTGENWVPTG